MKKLLNFFTATVIILGPAFFTGWLLFYNLAPFIISLLPENQWNEILSVAVYFAIIFFGGFELLIITMFYGFIIWELFFKIKVR